MKKVYWFSIGYPNRSRGWYVAVFNDSGDLTEDKAFEMAYAFVTQRAN